MKRLFILSIFLFIGYSYADSLYLYNDTPFQLTAIVQSANGKVLGQTTFQPGDQSNWDSDSSKTQLDINYDATSSYTPYTVIWRCEYGGFFAMCSNVAAGSNVSASECPGPHYCKPKPKKQNSEDEDDTSCNGCRPSEDFFLK
ncbi:MAG: hypothetical protein JXA94_05975 [Parachlamydiales bacterium]|nr:hypothetical protein [Parachlamydiales bacterium]